MNFKTHLPTRPRQGGSGSATNHLQRHRHCSDATADALFVPNFEPPNQKFHPATHADTELLRRHDLHKGRRETLLCYLCLRTSLKVLGLDWPRVRHSAWHYGLLRERRKATAQRFRRSQGGIAPLR